MIYDLLTIRFDLLFFCCCTDCSVCIVTSEGTIFLV